MNKKNILIGLISLLLGGTVAVGVAACDIEKQQAETTEIERIYAQYVVYAQAEGLDPLSYDAWLATIKGAQEETSEILQYQKIAGKEEYRVVGLGTVSDLDIVIPSTYKNLPVTEIGNRAFDVSAGEYLTSMVIPDSITSIGEAAFSGCSSLTSVVIGNAVTSIASSTFAGCSSLTSIVIPDSVTTIDYSAFSGCSSLTSVVIGNSVTSIGKGVFYGCSSLVRVVIGNSVTSIAFSTFAGCSSLTSIVIPDSVTSIGEAAFYGCSSLVSVVIPDSVTTIDHSAFSGCSSLTVYCETESKPSGWDSDWNYCFDHNNGTHYCTVVWGYKASDEKSP